MFSCRLIAGLLILAFSVSAFSAWDGTHQGQIHNLDAVVDNGNNFGVRITLSGKPALCGNHNTWAYINKSDDNYQATLSVLLSAKMADREVLLYTKKATSGYCHIGYVSVL